MTTKKKTITNAHEDEAYNITLHYSDGTSKTYSRGKRGYAATLKAAKKFHGIKS